jgi:hypothetical protein
LRKNNKYKKSLVINLRCDDQNVFLGDPNGSKTTIISHKYSTHIKSMI